MSEKRKAPGSAQEVLEGLPVLPAGVWVTDLAHQLSAPISERNGFMHLVTNEWNILYSHNGAMYRLPSSIAETMLRNQRTFN